MAFIFLTVRSGEEPADVRHPDPGEHANTVALEAADGDVKSWSVELIVEKARPAGSWTKVGEILNVDRGARLFVTDARTAFACSKFDKGGGFVGMGLGGVAIAGVSNAVSKARASRRSAGKMLVAHVPHTALTGVVGANKKGLGSRNRVVLIFCDPSSRTEARLHMLEFWLDKGSPGIDVARLIAHKAALAQAAELAGELRDELLAWAQSPTGKVADSGAHTYMWPGSTKWPRGVVANQTGAGSAE